MSLAGLARLFSLYVLCFDFINGYEIPDLKFEALKPKGLRVSIPDAPDLSLFSFQATINRPISDNDLDLSGEITQPTAGQWIFEDLERQLKVGDVINYYAFVTVGTSGYVKDNMNFIVRELVDPTTSKSSTPVPNQKDCKPTSTVVRGGVVCAGETIFEDNFDSLREDIWQVEQYIPSEHPEFPFVSYQRDAVSVSEGNLQITPTLQQDMPGYTNESIVSGELNLFSGCTGSTNECAASASGATILPPVASGRVTSKGLAFIYGTVHIRAKLPQGDWLYPEILLEPFRKKYGNMFASGVIKMACSRGNRELYVGVTEYGNKVLYGGPIMDYACRQYLITEKLLRNGKTWGDDFHVYTVRWTPDLISLLVDDEEWARIEPVNRGLVDRFPPHCRNLPRKFLKLGAKMAPFDDYFYITLGVAAGGITEFQDDVYTSNYKPKPWKNQGRKASLHFWEDQNSWLPTWGSRSLVVDYVKVVALDS